MGGDALMEPKRGQPQRGEFATSICSEQLCGGKAEAVDLTPVQGRVTRSVRVAPVQPDALFASSILPPVERVTTAVGRFFRIFIHAEVAEVYTSLNGGEVK
jgi:hypothetical protein